MRDPRGRLSGSGKISLGQIGRDWQLENAHQRRRLFHYDRPRFYIGWTSSVSEPFKPAAQPARHQISRYLLAAKKNSQLGSSSSALYKSRISDRHLQVEQRRKARMADADLVLISSRARKDTEFLRQVLPHRTNHHVRSAPDLADSYSGAVLHHANLGFGAASQSNQLKAV